MKYSIEVFSAGWCPNCPALKNSLTAAGIDFIVRDCDEIDVQDECMKLGIRSLPTTIIKDASGDVVRTIVGVQPMSSYTPYANTHLESDAKETVALNG